MFVQRQRELPPLSLLAVVQQVFKSIQAAREEDADGDIRLVQLIRDIFTTYGEDELVENDDIIDEMIAAAKVTVADDEDEDGDIEENGGVPLLNVRSFARALTSDTQLYDVENETRLTTFYYDCNCSRHRN